MKVAIALLALLAGAPTPRPHPQPLTRAVEIHYLAHNGVERPAWLLLPAHYDGWPIPLVISPHGRGIGAAQNADLWGDLPGEGNFAVINPAGEGRRTGYYSWGDPGEISDLARMPAIARAHGIHVSRVYAVGGSMGGQETLLLLARHPHLLAGAVAFDPATDMARRYRDFAALRDGRWLQRVARREIGGTPASDPRGYALRSPDDYVRRIAFSGVPLQLFWSRADRIISDQVQETGALAERILDLNPHARVWDFTGDWMHTAEMRPMRRLPRALARFGLLPWSEVPPLDPVTPTPSPLI
ncbi:MAG TPA: prolyl oligopeptidase family serine peptidase [Gaiellaceae bacterium]|nr:prolyl oligopeptidase family serine peptidase [Gaiellaceae bacterium]